MVPEAEKFLWHIPQPHSSILIKIIQPPEVILVAILIPIELG
jgi:hypothetical protein